MSELNPERDGHWLYLAVAKRSEIVGHRADPSSADARLDCEGCPVATGEVPDASCAECVVSVFLAAEPWPDDA